MTTLPRRKALLRRRGLTLLAALVAVALAITIQGAGASTAPVSGMEAPEQAPTSAYADQVLADSPISYWRLGETTGSTASDVTGANPGTYTGGVTLGQPGGLTGDPDSAAAFDGVNDYVLVPDSSSLDLTAGVTLEAWIKRNKSGVWQVVVGKPGNGLSKYENYALWFNTQNQVVAYFGDGVGFVSVVSPLDTNWHHVAASYNNATARLYVDGALAAQATSPIHLTANSLPLNLGRTNSGSYYFGGLLDEVAVYATALSSDRILAHYEAGRAIDGEPPVVTLDLPAHGSVAGSATPTFSGNAGTMQGDSATVTVKVYAGSDALGTPVQTLTTTQQAGAYSVDGLVCPQRRGLHGSSAAERRRRQYRL